MEAKKHLRKEMFKVRNNQNAEEKRLFDEAICLELETLILENKYQTIHAYIPIANEIDIAHLIERLLALNIQVVCPKTLPKRQLENRILKSLEEIEVGIMGTKHPKEATIYQGNYDLIIVPGLAFDDQHYRLGYGGGYYDNFLSTQPNASKVGIFYPFQKVATVPREAHDVRLDQVISD